MVAPTEPPPWQPTTILIARDNTDPVVPFYDAPDGEAVSTTMWAPPEEFLDSDGWTKVPDAVFGDPNFSCDPFDCADSIEDFDAVIYESGTRYPYDVSLSDLILWRYTYDPLQSSTEQGNPLVLRVVQGMPGDEWVEVELPMRPNGMRGWIRPDGFDWSTVTHHIHVDLSDRTLRLFDGDRFLLGARAAVGKPITPTPIVSGYIVEKIPNHDGSRPVVYGDWILMLSFFSEVVLSFEGRPFRLSLHGTHAPELLGEAITNGEIRVPNEIIETIASEAPLGTAINIVP